MPIERRSGATRTAVDSSQSRTVDADDDAGGELDALRGQKLRDALVLRLLLLGRAREAVRHLLHEVLVANPSPLFRTTK